MATLYHARNSRSTSLVALVEELGADIEVREVTIPRQDGTGRPDPDNPHPEKKVPYFVDGDVRIRERGAIILYLTDLYPDAGIGAPVGDPRRGAYLSWLFYYHAVMEPLLVAEWAGVDHPALHASFRDMKTMHAQISAALGEGAYLTGESYTAADLLCSSPFQWFPQMMPEDPAIRDWVARCADRPGLKRVMAQEA